jgi:hypothetical protein
MGLDEIDGVKQQAGSAPQIKSYETVEQIRKALILGLPITDIDREREFQDLLEIAKDEKYRNVIDENGDSIGTVKEFLWNLRKVRLLSLGITDEEYIRKLNKEYKKNVMDRINDEKNFEKGDKAVFNIENILESGKDDQYLERNIDNDIVTEQGIKLFEMYDRMKNKQILEALTAEKAQNNIINSKNTAKQI